MLGQNLIQPIKVLLIEDNPGDVRLVRERLLSAPHARFEVESVERLDRGVERLRSPGIDVVLLDLTLPDSRGVETITRLHGEAPTAPLIALSGLDDPGIIQGAVKLGAEDYLVKGAFSTDILVRTIRYAIDRQQSREALASARDSALEAERVRAEFLANMSHEIRTPLNGVVGMTRLLIDTLMSVDQREMLEIACMSADTLLKIVNEILDFSKISAGKVVLDEVDFELSEAVESVVGMFTEQAQVKGVVLDSFIEAGVPTRVRGDAIRLCQVLANLIGNAVKFTAAGQATIRVERVGGSADHSILRFQVRDTGMGIPIDGQRSIFQAFTQADGSTTRRFGGTGLGLAISAQLIELMGGSIGLDSEQGRGSTFWFTARFPHHAEPAAKDTGPKQSQLAGMRVLIVDCDALSARAMSEHVQAWRMRCEVVATRVAAMAALQQALEAGDHFAIAILDLQMPGHEWLDLAETIKARPELAGTRVLGLYALGNRPEQNLCRAAGIRALQGKPVRPSRLYNALVGLLAEQPESPPVPPPRPRTTRDISSRMPQLIRDATRILLVEDNLVNQQVEMRMIDRIGYHAQPAANGRIALEKLQLEDFDLILMDCQMPEVDGYTATREIRRREGSARHTSIIGVTAHALPGDREECLRAGMDDYIAKPVMPEDLAAMIDKWVEIIKTPNLLPESAELPSTEAGVKNPNECIPPSVIDEAVLAELREYQNPGEPDFLTELIGVFGEDLTDRLAQINAGLQAGDPERVRQAAHALKGASGELGAKRLREICARMELSATPDSIWTVPAMLRELQDEAVHVRAALAVHCVASRPLPTPSSEA
jgi:signal transduction histidine kinase/HPt (histidine-containing phosphotransfer) domain-containing protein